MASRAEPAAAAATERLVDAPVGSTDGAIRTIVRDLYDDSWRFAAVNVVWAVAGIATLVALVVVPPPLGWGAVALLGVPTLLVFRFGAMAARGHSMSIRAAWRGTRRDAGASVVLAGGLAAVVGILSTDLVGGLATGTPMGVALATLAFWGLVGACVFGWTAWPVLADPEHADLPATRRLRLAAMLALVRPGRSLGLALGETVLLGIGAITVVPLLTIVVSIGGLIAAHSLLPALDRLEAPTRV